MIKNNKGKRKTTSKVVTALLLGTAFFGQTSASQSMAAVRSSLQANLRNYLQPHAQNQALSLAQISEGVDLNSFITDEAAPQEEPAPDN